MRREYRLRKSRDFERVRSDGRSWAHPLLVAYARARGDDAPTRAGIVVSKRVGKATIRNRVKRRIREALRATYPTIRSGYDLIVIARPLAASTSMLDLSGALEQLLDRARVRSKAAPALDPVTSEAAS
jgi:ribonuclease P protein component